MNTTNSKKVVPTKKRILVVDDHPITRQGLALLIRAEADLMVCGEAENAQQALAALNPPLPDLILTDITMPGKSGLELIKDIRVLHPNIPVLVMSMHDESLYAERVLRAGANGYIMKSEGGSKVLEAIRQILQGQISVSKNLSESLMIQLVRGRPHREDLQLSQLTDREFGVFQLLGQGLITRDIGKRLHISPKTVETHRMHIKEKLGIKNSAELVNQAVRWAMTNQLI